MLTFSQFLAEDHHDSNGKVWYHGTSRSFKEPDFKGAKYLKHAGKHGTGFYLTGDPEVASQYADSRAGSKSQQYGKGKGVAAHVQPYRVHPHKTFDMEREHSPEEVHNLIHDIHQKTGHKIPSNVHKYLLDGKPKTGDHIHVNLRDMHPDKDANDLLRKAGYDSVSAKHMDAPELIALHKGILKHHFSEENDLTAGFAEKPEALDLHSSLTHKGFKYAGRNEGGWHSWSHPTKGDIRYSKQFGYEHRDGKKLIASGFPAIANSYASKV